MLLEFRERVAVARADTRVVAERTSALATSLITTQRQSYDCYNQCHEAWGHAWQASFDDGSSNHAGDGVALGAIVGGLATPQQTLEASNTTEFADIQWSRGEVVRLGEEVATLAAAAPTAAVALALRQALTSLRQADVSVAFDGTTSLAQTRSALEGASQAGAAIAADAPGVNVSDSARGAMTSLQGAEWLYGNLGGAAYQGAAAEVDASQNCREAAGYLDDAFNLVGTASRRIRCRQ